MSNLASFARAHRVPLALALLVIVVIGPVVAPTSAQPASRLALTAALVEHRSVDIGPYRQTLSVDFATYRGQLRSDKGPGQPLFAVPAYVLGRFVGVESAGHVRADRNLGQWWLTIWSATLPLALLTALMYVETRRFASQGTTVAVTLLMVFTTMLLPFGSVLFAHNLAALLGFGAWLLVNRSPIEPRRAIVAGLLAGAAVTMEYELAIVVVALVGYLVVRERPRVMAFLAGGVAPAVVLAWYQWRAFGAPWRTPAAFYNLESGYRVPSPYELWWIFGGGRGLWVGAPIAIVGIGTAIWLALRGRGELRDHAVIALATIVPYIVLCAGWSGTPVLVDPGPRYLIPALPFLAVPLAAKWERVRVIAIPASVIGALVAAGATWISLITNYDYAVLRVYRQFLGERFFNPTLWSMAFGRFGTVLYAASVAAAIVLLVRCLRPRAIHADSAFHDRAFADR